MDGTFLNEKIFTQEENVADPFSHVHHGATALSKEQEGGLASTLQNVPKILSFDDKKEDSSKMMEGLFQTARQMSSSSDKSRSYEELFDLFSSAFQQAFDMMKRSMELVWTADKRFHILSLWYYLEHKMNVRILAGNDVSIGITRS